MALARPYRSGTQAGYSGRPEAGSKRGSDRAISSRSTPCGILTAMEAARTPVRFALLSALAISCGESADQAPGESPDAAGSPGTGGQGGAAFDSSVERGGGGA